MKPDIILYFLFKVHPAFLYPLSIYNLQTFQLSLADLAVFNMVDSCVEMGWASLWNPYPNILKHRELVLENPRISQWTKTRPKTLV